MNTQIFPRTEKAFNEAITPDMIEAAKAVFQSMALVEVLRPEIEAIQKKVLKAGKYKPCLDGYRDEVLEYLMKEIPDYITDPKHAYRMSDKNMGHYCTELHKEYIKAGHKVEFQYCPLLIAESMEREAKRLFVDVCAPLTGINFDDVSGSLKNYKQLVELLLTMFASKVKV